MDPEWAKKISRHRDRINTANVTKDELGEYIKTKVYIHIQENFIDYILWIVFQEEFEGFITKDFRHI